MRLWRVFISTSTLAQLSTNQAVSRDIGPTVDSSSIVPILVGIKRLQTPLTLATQISHIVREELCSHGSANTPENTDG